MYYRYKVQRKRYSFVKISIVILLLGAAAFAGYRYRSYLQFWKLDITRMTQKVMDVAAHPEPVVRREKFTALLPELKKMRADEPLNSDVYLLSGVLQFLYGESLQSRSLTELYVRGEAEKLTAEQRNAYIQSIRYFLKSMALSNDTRLAREYCFMLARSLYYTSFYRPSVIIEQSVGWIDPQSVSGKDANRLLAILLVESGKTKEGLDHLLAKGKLSSSIVDQFLKGKILTEAGKVTDAITLYRSLETKAGAQWERRHLNFSLAKIYYKRYLNREALEYINKLVDIDPDDETGKLWKGLILYTMKKKNEALEVLKGTSAEGVSVDILAQRLGVE
jgi:tetratricopeptide (TPR) repeat protein